MFRCVTGIAHLLITILPSPQKVGCSPPSAQLRGSWLRALLFFFGLILSLLVLNTVFTPRALFVEMSRRCCDCFSNGVDRKATCVGCACATSQQGCTNCLLSNAGQCKNAFGHGPLLVHDSLVCPVDGCSAGKGGQPFVRRLVEASRMRQHVNDHLASGTIFMPSNDWLDELGGQLCKLCRTVITGLKESSCRDCKATGNVSQGPVPRADHLPKLQRNHVVQLSLGVSQAALDMRLDSDAFSSPGEAKHSTGELSLTRPDFVAGVGGGDC